LNHNAGVKNLWLLVVLLSFPISWLFAENRPAITGVAYVRVAAKDPATSDKFYTKTLKLKATECGQGCRRYQIGQTQAVEIVHTKGTRDGLIAVAFRTADADALRRYLEKRDVKVPSSITRHKDGTSEFSVNDPEQNEIIFVQSPPAKSKAAGISQRMIHAGFVVKDRARMDAFYKDLLGFRLYWHGGMKDDVDDWVDMQVPDGTDWLEYMLNVGPDADHRLLGIVNHFALGTNDIHAAAKQLEKTGWKESSEEKPQLGRDGKWQLNLYDPDETRVELMEFTPVEKPCCSEYIGQHPGK
jgi:catechol 2,3-dioxygenase-like lactoylglutathione lyase family enzyme/predicted enzyme related to lactoylglutathione lyase